MHPDQLVMRSENENFGLEIDESIPRVVDQIEAVAGATGLHCVDYKGDTLPW